MRNLKDRFRAAVKEVAHQRWPNDSVDIVVENGSISLEAKITTLGSGSFWAKIGSYDDKEIQVVMFDMEFMVHA